GASAPSSARTSGTLWPSASPALAAANAEPNHGPALKPQSVRVFPVICEAMRHPGGIGGLTLGSPSEPASLLASLVACVDQRGWFHSPAHMRRLQNGLVARAHRIEGRILFAADRLAGELDEMVRHITHAERGVDLAALQRPARRRPEGAPIVRPPAYAQQQI